MSETALRRSVSSAYCGLFHHLTTAGAQSFAIGNPGLAAQLGRAFTHTNMRRVCELYLRSRGKPLPPPFDRLADEPPTEKLLSIAQAFVLCQDARHAADYDLAVTIAWEEAVTAILAASDACLLADRWSRRG